MRQDNSLAKQEKRLLSALTHLIDKKEMSSRQEPEVYGWDDGKIYFHDGYKEHCIDDYSGLLKTVTEICRKYFALKEQKIERAKLGLAKGRTKKRRRKRIES